MGTRARPTTPTISKTPLTPPSRWLVSASRERDVTDLERDLGSPELKVVAEPVAPRDSHSGSHEQMFKRLRGEVASLKDTFARLASQKCRGQISLPLVVLYSRLSRATFGRTLRGAGSISGMKRHESFEHGFKID